MKKLPLYFVVLFIFGCSSQREIQIQIPLSLEERVRLIKSYSDERRESPATGFSIGPLPDSNIHDSVIKECQDDVFPLFFIGHNATYLRNTVIGLIYEIIIHKAESNKICPVIHGFIFVDAEKTEELKLLRLRLGAKEDKEDQAYGVHWPNSDDEYQAIIDNTRIWLENNSNK